MIGLNIIDQIAITSNYLAEVNLPFMVKHKQMQCRFQPHKHFRFHTQKGAKHATAWMRPNIGHPTQTGQFAKKGAVQI